MSRRRARAALAALALGAIAVACSSTASTPPPTTGAGSTAVTSGSGAAPATAAPPAKLRILVSNDDGVGAAGIDAVVEGLRALPDTEVTVVAPVANQSGTGGKTTDGPVTVTDATTASGYPAKAVAGFPADTIVWAIDQHGVAERPHVVVTGINIGQNLGPTADISGTIGAARAAAARGIPALASSQGVGATMDFPSGARLVTEWIQRHRTELLKTTTTGSAAAAASLFNLNVPSCQSGTLRAEVEVPSAAAAEGRDLLKSDCETPFGDPKDDVDAFIHGHPALSPLALQPANA